MVAERGGGSRMGNQLQDYSMIATACSRAGRRRDEALAHYGCAVLHENSGKLSRAVVGYNRMLEAASIADDHASRLIAQNCLGALKHRLADYDTAVEHHKKHLELADANGKFPAHLNLGLSLAELGDFAEAQAGL